MRWRCRKKSGGPLGPPGPLTSRCLSLSSYFPNPAHLWGSLRPRSEASIAAWGVKVKNEETLRAAVRWDLGIEIAVSFQEAVMLLKGSGVATSHLSLDRKSSL